MSNEGTSNKYIKIKAYNTKNRDVYLESALFFNDSPF